jgi:hypothetical protein
MYLWNVCTNVYIFNVFIYGYISEEISNIYMAIYIYVHICTYIYVYMYIYINIHR